MNTQLTNGQKPTLVNVIAWMTLASGIVNLFWGFAASGAVLAHSWGIGIICIPVTILPTVLGIFEVIYAAKLMSDLPQPIKPSTNIAILEILCVLVGNIFSAVVGILALIFYNDLTVKDYFARLNGTLVPVEGSAPVVLTSIPNSEPTPEIPAKSPSDQEPPSQDETPNKDM